VSLSVEIILIVMGQLELRDRLQVGGLQNENERRNSKMIRKRVLFCCIMLMTVYSAWSEDMDDATLKAILSKRDTTLIVYFMAPNVLTLTPVTEEAVREHYHDCKLLIVKHSAVNKMSGLIFAARKFDHERKSKYRKKYYEDVRMLIDVISDDVIVCSVGISSYYLGIYGDKVLSEKILDTFHELLGLSPDIFDQRWY